MEGCKTIFERIWYFRLVNGENSLSSKVNLENKFVVSYHLASKSGRNEVEKINHVFTAFDNHHQFIDFMVTVPYEDWSFFEVIAGEQPQKPYIDVDITGHPEELNTLAESVMTSIISCIVSYFQKHRIALDLNQDLMIFSSHSEKKRSFHLIINGYFVPNNLTNSSLLLKNILSSCPQAYLDLNYIDTSMYKSSQQFRLFLCGKAGTNRKKNLVQEWKFGEFSGKYDVPVDSSLQEMQQKFQYFSHVFLQSSITYIASNCKPLPFTKTERVEREVNLEIEDAQVAPLMAFINPLVFAFREASGDAVVIQRLKPSWCKACDRVHENENAMLQLGPGGNIFFKCFRNMKETIWLGKIELLEDHKEAPVKQVEEIKPLNLSFKRPIFY